FIYSIRRRHTTSKRDWSSDVCSSDLTSGQQFRFSPTDRNTMTERADAGAYLANVLRSQAMRTDLPNYQQPSEVVPVGTLGGIDLGVLRHGKTVQLVVADMPSIRREWSVNAVLDQLSATG